MVTFSISSRKRKLNRNNYVLVHVPEHPKSFEDGWYYEHRVIIEQYLNRPLKEWETIHHINGDKTDNSLKNLFVCSANQHYKAHLPLTNN